MTDDEIQRIADEIIGQFYTEFASIAIGVIIGAILFRSLIWIYEQVF